MDPLTAIGAVASIWQIAQAALTLSKTLHALSGAVGSASEDLQILADDLKTFSQSLSLLSRLLEDSKAWYSDDIYLLTAKIIKDCAELYVKIDKILMKLGGNGKSTWKLRVKFVYKESQIQKLLSRLRDMKGTLATILMSLQVDLQLSLLNISSTSKIQRPPGKPLQPNTIRILQEAQGSIMAAGVLTKYSVQTEAVVQVSHIESLPSTTPSVMNHMLPPASCSIHSTEVNSASLSCACLNQHESSSDFFHATRTLMAFPPNVDTQPAAETRDAKATTTISHDRDLHGKSSTQPAPVSIHGTTPDVVMDEFKTSRSLKSSSSTESFKSAFSILENDFDVAQKVKAVQSVMHAFETAIQILDNLIERRIPKTKASLLKAAEGLGISLNNGKRDINRLHIQHFKRHGDSYIQSFDVNTSSEIQTISSDLMKDVVMKLHEYSAEHEEIHASHFEALCKSSKDVSHRVSRRLTSLATTAALKPRSDVTLQKRQRQESFDVPFPPIPAPAERPEMVVPFIGYTFKRFDEFRRQQDHVSSTKPACERKPEIIGSSEENVVTPKIRDGEQPDSSKPWGTPGQAAMQNLDTQFTLDADLDFMSTVAAGLQASGFDPENVLNDPAFPKRDSTPTSTSRPTYDGKGDTGPRAAPQFAHSISPLPRSSQQNSDLIKESYASQRGLNYKDIASSNSAEDAARSPADKINSASGVFAKELTLAELEHTHALRAAQDQPSPPSTAGIEYHDHPNDALCRVRSQVNSIKRELMPLHIPPHVRDVKSRRLSEPVVADDFGNFAFKNLLVLEKANEAVNQNFREQAFASNIKQLESSAPMATSVTGPEKDVPTKTPELQEYQKQLLATVPDDTREYMLPKPYSWPQPIEQQKQATRDYRLSLMPGHDPDSQESIDAHSKALQDYQMSLMTLNCRVRKNPRLQMVRISDEKAHTPVSHINSQPRPITPLHSSKFFGSSIDSIPTDLLADFDFDSFLRDDPSGSDFVFDTVQPPLAGEAGNSKQAEQKEELDAVKSEVTQGEDASPLFSSQPDSEEPPVYLNSKQFLRILKRRAARQRLAEHQFEQNSPRRWDPDDADSYNEPETSNPSEESVAKTEASLLLPITQLPKAEDFGVSGELAWTYPALSPFQTRMLWWQAYISLVSNASKESPVFTTIKNLLQSELDVVALRYLPDDAICKRIAIKVRRFADASHNDKPELAETIEIRNSIIKVLTTIEEHLGLEVATLGWSCTCVLLSLYEKIISDHCSIQNPTSFPHTSYTNLQIIVSIIARYAVMENLYQNTTSTLSLKPEYCSALISLCSTILEYFATAIQHVEIESGFEDEEVYQKCEFLVEVIRKKDAACQGFRVLVDTVEIGEESESEDAGIEDVSDEDWERINIADVSGENLMVFGFV